MISSAYINEVEKLITFQIIYIYIYVYINNIEQINLFAFHFKFY